MAEPDKSYLVHRLRIGDWAASAISSIATNHYSSKIAVGRDDGDIEILDSNWKFYSQARIPGMKNFKLQALAWSTTEQNRLFGISLRGFLFEVDLGASRIKNIRDSYGGAAWCLATSPRSPVLAVGCEDGAVRLFRYSDRIESDIPIEGSNNGSSSSSSSSSSSKNIEPLSSFLEYSKTLPTSGARVLSIAFHPIEPKIFIGCSDSTIRCLEESTGRVLYRMTADISKGAAPTSIWTLLSLRDGTVVSGDSRGNVQMWDGSMGVLISTYRQHTADVLTMTTNREETCIFAAGVDSKVVCLQNVNKQNTLDGSNSSSDNSGSRDEQSPYDARWMYTHSQRPHTHDVLSMAIVYTGATGGRNKAKSAPITSDYTLLTGGLDTKICSYSVSRFQTGSCRPSWIPSVPCNSLISHSTDYGLLTIRHRNYVDIWGTRMQGPDTDHSSSSGSSSCNGGRNNSDSTNGSNSKQIDNKASRTPDNCQLSIRLQAKGPEHLHCSSLSPCGRLLAVSSLSGMRLWRVTSPFTPVPAPMPMPTSNKRRKKSLSSLSMPEQANGNGNGFTASKEPQRTTVRPLSLPEELAAPWDSSTNTTSFITAMAFSNDSSQMAAFSSPDGRLLLFNVNMKDADADLDPDADSVASCLQLGQVLEHKDFVVRDGEGSSNEASAVDLCRARHSVDEQLALTVKKILFSRDAQFMAVADNAMGVYVYDIDRHGMHWRLPRRSSIVTDIKIIQGADDWASTGSCGGDKDRDQLAVLYADNTFLVFDIISLRPTAWSQRSLPRIPKYLLSMPGALAGIADSSTRDTIFLYGQGFCVMIDLTKDIPSHPKVISESTSKLLSQSQKILKKQLKKKKKRGVKEVAEGDDKDETEEGGAEISNFVIFNIYRNLIHVGCMENNQMVIVENPFARQLQQMPDTLDRKRYGT